MIRAKSNKKLGPRVRKTYRLTKNAIKDIAKIAKVNEWAESEAIEKAVAHWLDCSLK
jgi:hypothetical protein